ncbi:hypothetical protein [Xanthomonas campestris]|uniref:hypothetical protein n=1 Tax=Xanthomonas campestris TaxID=339 RepID=UPI002B233AD7|nr:hypothetical protein [Xanthomonas campestris]MEA9770233.1 hypothetical protein [Xanthomonas campestris pv. raphani]MEA9801578.1 hypothetical protein [Xanthomonas campestris pv. raphani]MEA9830735.1 hypothetical protein [Xanthomonas campestris pv. raphani]MEA9919980.1 hypothetical protein [Xanthomonas campestris pv. raphani]MEA9949381.1 hypothetical protein [Xanthomonas campestris pv. raphani]
MAGDFKDQRSLLLIQGLLQELPVDHEASSTRGAPTLIVGAFAPPLDPGHARSVILVPRTRGFVQDNSEFGRHGPGEIRKASGQSTGPRII